MTDAPFNPTGWTKAELKELEQAWTRRSSPAPLLREIRRATLRGRTVVVTATLPPPCFRLDHEANVLELLYYPGTVPDPWDPEDARRQAERVLAEYPEGTRFVLLGERAQAAGRGILEGSEEVQ